MPPNCFFAIRSVKSALMATRSAIPPPASGETTISPAASSTLQTASAIMAARFADDFESAVLHAVNGGGQNQARAILTGALVGAMVGLSGIPERFVTGLARHEARLQLARRIAAQAAA